MGDPAALGVAVAAMQACQLIGRPECDVVLSQCATYLARANKSHEVDNAMNRVKHMIKQFNEGEHLPAVPIHLRNATSSFERNLGYYYLCAHPRFFFYVFKSEEEEKYCKEENGGPLFKTFSNCLVISYLLCGLAWAVVGFLWVFGAYEHLTCGADSATYQFAFATLIILNMIMDFWICFKICVVLYWAFLTDD